MIWSSFYYIDINRKFVNEVFLIKLGSWSSFVDW